MTMLLLLFVLLTMARRRAEDREVKGNEAGGLPVLVTLAQS